MNPFHHPRHIPHIVPRWTAWAALILALNGCLKQDRLAGTSVGTGNPTEIEVAFVNEAGEPVPVEGSLKVYASRQIPVRGFSPDPLVEIPVNGATSAVLEARALGAVRDSLWPRGSIDAGAYAFNLVVEDESRGAVLKGFAWRRSRGDFVLRPQDGAAGGGPAVIPGKLVPMAVFECSVDTSPAGVARDDYLFIYGTGFVATKESGLFSLDAPAGTHEVFFLSVPRPDDPAGKDKDSLDVLGFGVPVSAGALNRLQGGRPEESVPMPAYLKAN